jgi:hypothetical protein
MYVPSQQLQSQLQTQHSIDTSNYIMDKSQSLINGKHWRKNTLIQRSKQRKKESNNNNNNFINTNRSCYWELRNVKYKYLEINNNNNSIQFLFMYVQT